METGITVIIHITCPFITGPRGLVGTGWVAVTTFWACAKEGLSGMKAAAVRGGGGGVIQRVQSWRTGKPRPL